MSTATMTLKTVPRLLGFTTLLLASMFLLSSCQAEIKSVEPTLNPNPKEIYEITVTVENAPGEFTSAKGQLRLQIHKTWSCLPLTSFSGVPTVAWGRNDKVNFKRTAQNAFSASVALDRYTPNDDYGKGLCQWDPGGVSVDLYNGVNTHTVSISPQSETVNKRAYKLDLFALVRDPPSKVPPPPGGWPSEKLPPNISGWNIEYNQKQYNQVFSNDEYFFISISAQRINP